jgi:NitT/TauT family transport system permease protein
VAGGLFYRSLSLLTGLTLFALWWAATSYAWVDTAVLPSPGTMYDTAASFFSGGYAGKSALEHLVASVLRTFTGLFGGIVLGVPIGLLIGYYRAADAVLGPIFSFIRPVPPIAFIPLAILYFGIGELPKVLLIGAAAFWYVVLNTSNGVRSVPVDLIRAALNLGVRPHQLMFRVVLPASLPHIMTGVKTATALSWAIVVAAELVAAQMGLGYLIMDAATFFRVPYVYLGIIIIGIIGLALEFLTNIVESRWLHWRGR